MTIEQAHQGGIASAHAAFERFTGGKYMLHHHRIFAWEKFLVRRKFTVDDIGIVVRYLQGEVTAGRAFKPQLWFCNLIEDLDRFEQYLNDANAKKRNAPILWTDKDSVLHATGRVTGDLKKKMAQSDKMDSISMNDRVRWHLEEMRRAIK